MQQPGRWGRLRRPAVHVLAAAGLVSVAVAGAAPSDASAPAGPRVMAEVPATAEDLRVMPAFNSPMLASDPNDERFVALASRVDNPDFGCALRVSGDAGRTWLPVVTFTKLPDGVDKCYAPEVAFDADGVLYYLFVGLAGAGNEPVGAFLTTSSDRARTFSPPRRVLGPLNFAVRMAIHRGAGGKGRLHLVWLHATSDPPLGAFGPPPNPIMAKHSDDGGRTFSDPVQVSDPDRQRVVAPALVLAPDGAVHVAYYDLGNDAVDYQGLEGPTWEGTWSVVLATSVNGGRRFERGVVVDEQIVPPERVMLIFTMPPPALAAGERGRVVAGWTDGRNGDWDVLVRQSADGGRNWTVARRLNDDPAGNGRHQYLPRLSVAPGGRFDAIYYDRRDDPENLRNHVSYTYSSDGGGRFSPRTQLTSAPSDPRIGTGYPIPSATGQVEIGSRLGLVSTRSRALTAWTDTRNGFLGTQAQSVFTATVSHRGSSEGGGGSPWAVAVAAVAVVLAGGAVGAQYRRARPNNGPS